jgi:RNA polymerase sigma-70 factor (ECF subfamily)
VSAIFPTVAPARLSLERVTDSELVERARAGEAAAFGELMTRHGQAVYRTALAALGSPADAEEVVQEAFVRAYARLGTFEGRASFRTWASAIAWKQALSRRRSLVRRLRLFVQPTVMPLVEPVADAPSVEALLLSADRVRVVTALVRALPKRLRDPLLMAATEQHTYEEIAAILGIPEGTLKWRVSEARRLLKRKLEKLGYSR